MLLINRFPCSIDNCTKEYRTQWELNSHRRAKHADATANQIDEQEMLNELPIQLLDNTKPSPPKIRNKQKIIYVLPGPQMNSVCKFCHFFLQNLQTNIFRII